MKIAFSLEHLVSDNDEFIKEVVCNYFADVVTKMSQEEFKKIFRVAIHELTSREDFNGNSQLDVQKFLVDCEININEQQY